MFVLGNNLARLCVGNKFATHPPAKAVDGVLKSHILIGKSPWGRKPEALKDYFFGLAKIAEKNNGKKQSFMFYV